MLDAVQELRTDLMTKIVGGENCGCYRLIRGKAEPARDQHAQPELVGTAGALCNDHLSEHSIL